MHSRHKQPFGASSGINSKINKHISMSGITNGLELSQSYVSAANNDFVMTDHILNDIGKQKMKSDCSSESEDVRFQNTQLLEDVNTLVQQNFELNQGLNQLNDEVLYLKLREKKLKYLIHLLHERGYPVHAVFNKQVQPIETLRFEEFLMQKEQEAAREAELDAQNQFSFNESDSYDLMTTGPALRPEKPDLVPELNFEGLPEYITTSEEGDYQPGISER